jgi:DNA-binding Lrp family transcriptional regulator
MAVFVLTDIFGKCLHVRILEVLAENAGYDISIPEIHAEVGGAKTTVYSHIKRLEHEGLVKRTRKVGKSQLYTLDLEDPRARMVSVLEKLVVSERLTRVLEEEGVQPIEEVPSALRFERHHPHYEFFQEAAVQVWRQPVVRHVQPRPLHEEYEELSLLTDASAAYEPARRAVPPPVVLDAS